MQKRLVLDQQQIDITLKRFCYQLIENHDDFENTVFLGLQPRGTLLLDKIVALLKEISGLTVPSGYLDATFHRDDFRRRDFPLKANETKIDFLVEGKKSGAHRRCIIQGKISSRCDGCHDCLWKTPKSGINGFGRSQTHSRLSDFTGLLWRQSQYVR